jgi:hypothetical protein
MLLIQTSRMGDLGHKHIDLTKLSNYDSTNKPRFDLTHKNCDLTNRNGDFTKNTLVLILIINHEEFANIFWGEKPGEILTGNPQFQGCNGVLQGAPGETNHSLKFTINGWYKPITPPKLEVYELV